VFHLSHSSAAHHDCLYFCSYFDLALAHSACRLTFCVSRPSKPLQHSKVNVNRSYPSRIRGSTAYQARHAIILQKGLELVGKWGLKADGIDFSRIERRGPGKVAGRWEKQDTTMLYTLGFSQFHLVSSVYVTGTTINDESSFRSILLRTRHLVNLRCMDMTIALTVFVPSDQLETRDHRRSGSEEVGSFSNYLQVTGTQHPHSFSRRAPHSVREVKHGRHHVYVYDFRSVPPIKPATVSSAWYTILNA
jgi:hypothetical protein